MPLALDDLSLNWADFEAAGRDSRELLHELAEDPVVLRHQVLSVAQNDDLLDLCERVNGIYCIVLTAGLGSSRLEVQFAPGGHTGHPHDQPYSFSTYILAGGWEHTWYARPSGRGDQNGSDIEGSDDPESLIPYVTRFEQPGTCYSVHHGVIHGLESDLDTVALAFRGPVQQEAESVGRGHRRDPLDAAAYEKVTVELERLGII